MALSYEFKMGALAASLTVGALVFGGKGASEALDAEDKHKKEICDAFFGTEEGLYSIDFAKAILNETERAGVILTLNSEHFQAPVPYVYDDSVMPWYIRFLTLEDGSNQVANCDVPLLPSLD